ncbi:uncharacterized protein LAJ45_05220 [Morchella importuna]|uniref:DASH complex subunit DAD2 n=1 Tax=Morchella conica CCBAS932 TaxID=1392247 RepID=A0A3N4KVC5_9PEZI|nr:uncharacterized protein LAJ45_05220 [Morchella importuna]KAH8150524.1 hypothetical protein LAJ45_05220 [Morchella importuna]RPB14513.1 hypothetical protein P167DRAFT_533938 [Morchella conica CCBAS932]
MSNYPNRYSQHFRQPSASTSASGSPALVARINEKKQELENLMALRDLSAGLAKQMEELEGKLATLTDGTEAVAAVLSNWHNVLRAIAMASSKIPQPKEEAEEDNPFAPKPKQEKQEEHDGLRRDENGVLMPQTLVRIPVLPQK